MGASLNSIWGSGIVQGEDDDDYLHQSDNATVPYNNGETGTQIDSTDIYRD